MPFEKHKANLWLFVILGLSINWVQAYFTELDPDEAYYWIYSRYLDWGYFDHPPGIAVLVKMGYSIIHNSLGVRLFIPICQAITFWGIWVLAGAPKQKADIISLGMLFMGVPILQVFGFIATPDAPLLLFAVLFLIIYNRFNAHSSWLNTIWLGISMAVLLYSKYHGLLLILFVLASNLTLLTNVKFYLGSAFGAVLYIPHLLWQFNNGFPSFAYHLYGRDDVYKVKYTLEYLVNQAVVFSPLLFPFLILALLKKRTYPRVYAYILLGFLTFFFFSSFKGHTEPQWTAIAAIPVILILYWNGKENNQFRKQVNNMALLSAGLVLIARILLMIGVTGPKSGFNDFGWIQALKERAGERPVYFENTYRDVSKYAFYTQSPAYGFTNIDYRKNQFDLLDNEKILNNQNVLVYANPRWICSVCKPEEFLHRKLNLIDADSLQIYQKLQIRIIGISQQPDGRSQARIEVENPYPFNVYLNKGNLPLEIKMIFWDAHKNYIVVPGQIAEQKKSVNVGKSQLNILFRWPDFEVERIGAGFSYEGFPPSIQSKPTKLKKLKP